MMGMVKLVESKDLGDIKTPLPDIASHQDQGVGFDATRKAFSPLESRAKKLVSYEKALDPFQHIPAGDILSLDTTREVVDMITGFILENIKMRITFRIIVETFLVGVLLKSGSGSGSGSNKKAEYRSPTAA